MIRHGPSWPDGCGVPEQPRPRPEHGAVWVQPWTDEPAAFWHHSWEDETGPLWRATWEDGGRVLQSPPSSRDEAVAWACSVPAAWRLVRSSGTGDWEELVQP